MQHKLCAEGLHFSASFQLRLNILLHLWEMYALLNVLLYIAVYGAYKS